MGARQAVFQQWHASTPARLHMTEWTGTKHDGGGSWGVWMTVSIACINTRSLAYDPVDRHPAWGASGPVGFDCL